MAALKNLQHERFCQGLLAGKTQKQAYADAGYVPSKYNASRLKNTPEITARMAELNERAAERVMVTRETIAAQLDEDRAVAKEHGQAGSMVAATTAKAKLYGLFVDRRLLGVQNIDNMSEEELLEFIGGEPDPDELAEASKEASYHPPGHA